MSCSCTDQLFVPGLKFADDVGELSLEFPSLSNHLILALLVLKVQWFVLLCMLLSGSGFTSKDKVGFQKPVLVLTLRFRLIFRSKKMYVCLRESLGGI